MYVYIYIFHQSITDDQYIQHKDSHGMDNNKPWISCNLTMAQKKWICQNQVSICLGVVDVHPRNPWTAGIPTNRSAESVDDFSILQTYPRSIESNSALGQVIIVKLWKWSWSTTIWLFNIAMGNGPFIDSLPIRNGDLQWLC